MAVPVLCPLQTFLAVKIYDFDKSFVMEMQKAINPKLKSWAGVSLRVENGLLFRAKENFGLGITPIFDHFQRMQLIKCDLLQNSVDDSIRTLYKHRENIKFKMLKSMACFQCFKSNQFRSHT